MPGFLGDPAENERRSTALKCVSTDIDLESAALG